MRGAYGIAARGLGLPLRLFGFESVVGKKESIPSRDTAGVCVTKTNHSLSFPGTPFIDLLEHGR